MRLDRFIGSRLACSARSAQLMIAAREVLLNGVPATDGSQAVSTFCRVEVAGRVLRAREPVYLMLHKPRGCVSATTDGRNATVLTSRAKKSDGPTSTAAAMITEPRSCA